MRSAAADEICGTAQEPCRQCKAVSGGEDFNHKKRVFNYIEEKEENNQELNNFTNQIEDDFGSLITIE